MSDEDPRPHTPSFRAGTGLGGATEPGQKVTLKNVAELPPGSVVRIDDGSRLIHLHPDWWLWCRDGAWSYGRLNDLAWRLEAGAVLCHMPWYSVNAALAERIDKLLDKHRERRRHADVAAGNRHAWRYCIDTLRPLLRKEVLGSE